MTAPHNTLPEGWSKATADESGRERYQFRSNREDPATLREDEEGIELARTIGEHDVRRIPVVDGDGELTGIVTVDDLVATIGEQLDHVAETIEVQSPEYSP